MMVLRLLVTLLVLCSALPLAWGQGQLFNTNLTVTGTINAGTAAGTATAYTLTLNPPITVYTSNQCFTWKVHTTNTGAATLAVNGAGAKALKKFVGVTVSDLAASDLPSGQIVQTCYDGTNMLLVGTGSTGSSGGGSSAFSALTSGANTTATMQVDTGASLTPMNAGVIRATSLRSNPTLPATCTVGDLFFDTDAPAGQNVYGCTVTNTWTYQGLPPGGGTGLPSDPAPCPANQFATDQSSTGVLTCAQPSLSTLSDGASAVTLTGAQRVSNKQHILREVPYTPDGANSITPQCDTTDVVVVNTMPANLTVNNMLPTCTGGNPQPSQTLDFRFFCSASRTITWGTDYAETAGVPKPTVCTGNGTTFDYAKVRYNSVNGKLEFVATRATGPGIAVLPSSTTYTCNVDTSRQCQMSMTGTSGILTIAAPTGSPTDGQMVLLLFACQNLQTLAFNAIFLPSPNVPLPTTCPADLTKLTAVGVRYTTLVSGGPKWQVLGTN